MEAKLLNASLAYAKALQSARDAAGQAPGQAPGIGALGAGSGPQFADVLREAAESVVATTGQSEAISLKSITGETNLIDVVAAVNAAEITLQTVVAVRDRVIAAYQEIIRMPI
jgi:flagellar hook-basal body complex protein FliE